MFLDVGTRVGQNLGSKSAELTARWSIVVNLVQGPLDHCTRNIVVSLGHLGLTPGRIGLDDDYLYEILFGSYRPHLQIRLYLIFR